MNRSESIIELAKSLFKFQATVSKIGKDAKNPFLKNSYASLSNILDNVDHLLIDCGLVVMQNPGASGDMVTLNTILMHAETGQYIESEFSMTPVKKDPQAIGSCITYMRRYALVSILKLNVDDDDDGNGASSVGKRESINDKLGLTTNGGKAGNNKQTPVYSAKFKELKSKLELVQSPSELDDIGASIKESITDANELKTLRGLFASAKERLTQGTD